MLRTTEKNKSELGFKEVYSTTDPQGRPATLGENLAEALRGNFGIVERILGKKADKTSFYHLSQLANWYQYQDRADARQYVPIEYRGYGQVITYQLANKEWVFEQYIGNYGTDFEGWETDNTKWEDLKDYAPKKETASSLNTKATKTSFYHLSQLANWYQYQDRADARQYVPIEYRGYGQVITYQLANKEWVFEQYIGNYGTDFEGWETDNTKWEDLKDYAPKKETASSLNTKATKTSFYHLSQLANWYQYQDRADARQYVPIEYRGYGQVITYQLASKEWVFEQYLGDYGTDFEGWETDNTKWEDLKSKSEFDVSKYKNWYEFWGKGEARKSVPDFYRKNGAKITYQLSSGGWITEQYNGKYGDNAKDWLHDAKWINLNPTSSKFQGKRAVWVGTSIPANLYPEMVGRLLGMEVYNESYPSSCARRGAIDHTDGIGLTGCGWTVAWSLSQTYAEKEEIINNWDYWKTKFVGDRPDSLSEDDKNVIRWSTFENKLGKYLPGGQVGAVDYYIFDHSHNDGFASDTEEELTTVPSNPYDRNYFIGAMNFLIDYILRHNPRAKIILIGHYTDDPKGTNRANLLCKAQEVIAKYWQIPICKVWEKSGFSASRTVTTNGYWDAKGVWHDTGFDGTNNVSSNLTGNDQNPRQENGVWVHDLTLKQIWMQDDLHPHTDECRMHIANIIAPWMMANAS